VSKEWLLMLLIEEFLTSEMTSGRETEFVEFCEVESDSSATEVSSGAQRTLVYAGEMGLLVEESVKWVVTPIRAVDASVATTGSRGLKHALEGSGWGNDSSSSSLRVLIRIFCWRLGLDD
jgi:hypothetical protein